MEFETREEALLTLEIAAAEKPVVIRKVILGRYYNFYPAPKTLPRSKPLTCPNCGFLGYTVAMYRWHFNNCKGKPC